ncbi:nuclear transport factor 2 family protein [Burkholderia sp. Bp9031]|nr:nuclear transport factor 2 family protein [Burkholderia sp. Bp9031]
MGLRSDRNLAPPGIASRSRRVSRTLSFPYHPRGILTSRETIDRLEIQDLLTRYCHAADRRDWNEFERLFAGNAMLDYAAFGGPVGNRADITRSARHFNCMSCTRFPHVSSSTATRTGPASIGASVKRTPSASSRANSASRSSTWNDAAGMPSS